MLLQEGPRLTFSPETVLVTRVAVITYHSSPLLEPGVGDAGGMTIYVRGLAGELARRGVHTDIFTRATDEAARPVTIAPGVRVVPIDAGPRESLPKAELPRYLDDFVTGVNAFSVAQHAHYDLVHSHYWQSGLAGRVLAENWGVPFVHSAHTLAKVKNMFLAPGDSPEPQGRLAGETEVIDSADVLVASTDAEYRHLACLYRGEHDRLKTLTPGVDHELFRPGDRSAARAELDLGDEAILLYVGRIQPLKGLELAIRALDQLRHALERPPLLLVVGGASGTSGDLELERLRVLAADLGVEDHVRFCGPQPHHRLPTYYRAAEALLVCSYSESFGFAALEAHACGLPVVGTPVGALSHVVLDGRSGFLLDERDPALLAARLKTILSDQLLAEGFSDAARASVAPYTWPRAADDFLELYECLAADRWPELCTS
jgi:D-inositol-3-phosphate glycosyltransferase